jgi:hypothetical protein
MHDYIGLVWFGNDERDRGGTTPSTVHVNAWGSSYKYSF